MAKQQFDRIYFDYNATAPIREAVIDAVQKAMRIPSNASSIHTEGRQARANIENCRRKLALSINNPKAMIVFTSSATESIQLALDPHLKHEGSRFNSWKLLTTPVEHSAVLVGGRFEKEQISFVKVKETGVVDLRDLSYQLERFAKDSPDKGVIISIQYANSETGIIQPIKEISDIVHKYNYLLHCDAVQAYGRCSLDMSELGIDMMSLSAHKMGGPLGVGALVCASDHIRPTPLLKGGGQERGLRSGTENSTAIIGFSAAIECFQQSPFLDQLEDLRKAFEDKISHEMPEVEIIGRDNERMAGTTSLALPQISASSLLMQLDLMGISVSTGSACSSGKVSKSHVLKAMNIDDELSSRVIRISGGHETSQEHYDRAFDALKSIYMKLLHRSEIQDKSVKID